MIEEIIKGLEECIGRARSPDVREICVSPRRMAMLVEHTGIAPSLGINFDRVLHRPIRESGYLPDRFGLIVQAGVTAQQVIGVIDFGEY